MDKLLLLATLLFVGVPDLCAQAFPGKGVPRIRNYTPDQYGTPGKTWEIKSAANGIVYFATDQGLLEFDGARWQRYTGSKGFTRSLFIAADSVLYTGADKDFGRWQKNNVNQLRYTSLNPFRASTKGLNEEFWGTYQIEEDYVFVSHNNVYLYKEQQLTKLPAPSRFYGSHGSGDTVYVFDEQSGLYGFDGFNLTPLASFSADFPDPPLITGVHPQGNRLLVVTRGQGLFELIDGQLQPLNNEVNAYLKKDQAFSFTTIGDTHYAFGTILNGVYITDLAGNIIQHLNKQKGLLNNTILSMHYSERGRLWLGMDFGIAAVNLSSNVTYFLDQPGQVGTGQTGLLHEGIFYLGTNQGLYYTEWEALNNGPSVPDFKLVPGSSGQVWALSVVEGSILCGHDRGLFQLSDNSFFPLREGEGVLAISPFGDRQLLSGSYNGISLFRQIADRWTFVKKIPPVQGACNQLLPVTKDTLWLNLPNFGIIRARLDENQQITGQKIFPAQSFAGELPQLRQDSDTLKVITQTAAYHYQAVSDTFVATARPPTIQEIANPLPGTYQPIMLNESYGFVPVHNGFALKNTDLATQPYVAGPLVIRSVSAFNNDTTSLVGPGQEIPSRLNNIRIHFIAPQQEHATYQYRLENHTEGWSTWSAQPHVDYVNLPEGSYTFRVKAKIGQAVIPEQSVSFSIACPWYRTLWAYVGYALSFVALLYLSHLWQGYKLRQRQQQQQVEEIKSQRLQAAAAAQEDLLKRYSMLEEALGEIKNQLRSKTIELARKAKENDEKGRVLQALKEKINALEGQVSVPKFQFSQLSRILANYADSEDDSFTIQLEELHQNFFAKLNEKYPELTNYDQRLCAYLKSGLTTREIAELMNVLPSSVNVSRSRLRKKLALDPKVDLYKFLNSLK